MTYAREGVALIATVTAAAELRNSPCKISMSFFKAFGPEDNICQFGFCSQYTTCAYQCHKISPAPVILPHGCGQLPNPVFKFLL
jgi:hypothetical protein